MDSEEEIVGRQEESTEESTTSEALETPLKSTVTSTDMLSSGIINYEITKIPENFITFYMPTNEGFSTGTIADETEESPTLNITQTRGTVSTDRVDSVGYTIDLLNTTESIDSNLNTSVASSTQTVTTIISDSFNEEITHTSDSPYSTLTTREVSDHVEQQDNLMLHKETSTFSTRNESDLSEKSIQYTTPWTSSKALVNPKLIPSIRLNESYGITPFILTATSTTGVFEDTTPLKENVSMGQTNGDVMQQFLQMPLLLVMICAIFVFLLLIIGWISSLILLNSHHKKKLRKLKQDCERSTIVHRSSDKPSFTPIIAWNDDFKQSTPFSNSNVSDRPSLPMAERAAMSMSTFKGPFADKAKSSSKSYR